MYYLLQSLPQHQSVLSVRLNQLDQLDLLQSKLDLSDPLVQSDPLVRLLVLTDLWVRSNLSDLSDQLGLFDLHYLYHLMDLSDLLVLMVLSLLLDLLQ
jgi:hypothetical protein